jgi:hypothetical protein
MRTPSNPCDLRLFRLGVRAKLEGSVFLAAGSLSSAGSAAFAPHSPMTRGLILPSPYLNRIGTRNDTDFGAQWLACTDLHIERSRQKCCHLCPFEEGRSRWLVVLRKPLSFSIPSRFIPAHPVTFFTRVTFFTHLLESDIQ